MHRRSANGRKSRVAASTSRPTPLSSAYTTPASSALPSAYASEAEAEADPDPDIADDLANMSISAITGDVPIANAPRPKKAQPKPFRFLDLPYDLRLEVYDHHFAAVTDVLDLDHDNYRRVHPKLAILRTCRTIYREAAYQFWSTHPVRIFPTSPGRFFKTKKPLLARLKPGQRGAITSLELRLGPGWSKPPRGWVVNPELGLGDCANVHKVVVFVECDPGNEVFRGFRRSEGFYEGFSKSLLEKVLDEMPGVTRVEFDAWPSVRKSGALVQGLLGVVAERGLERGWGPERGWTDAEEVEDPPKSLLDLNAPILSAPELQNLLLHGASIEALA